MKAYENFKTAHPIIYKVGLGMGYLELPQGKEAGYLEVRLGRGIWSYLKVRRGLP